MLNYHDADSLARHLRPQTSIGPYECAEELGRGGFGSVYRAWDARLSRWVALKVLRDTEEMPRFRREAQLAAGLNHPNIVQVYEVGENYIAMQLIEGKPASATTPRRAAEIVRDAARAVQHAHDRGILHRDLKPANLMVDGAGRTWVLDFGLAKPVRPDATALSATGYVLGTPQFMSPEQVRGQADVRSDVYGLGATLYALVSGHSPHTGSTPYEVLKSAVEQEPAPISGEIGIVAAKAIEKDPSRRYATLAELADDLDRYLRDEPILARRPSLGYRLRKHIRRQPWIWGLSALLLVAVAVAAILGLRPKDPHDRWTRRIREISEERAAALDDAALARSNREIEEILRELAPYPQYASLRGECRLLLHDEEGAIREFANDPLGRARARIKVVQDLAVVQNGKRPPHTELLADLERASESRLAQVWLAVLRGDVATVERIAAEEIARGGRNEEFYFARGLVRSGEDRLKDYDAAIDRNRGEPRFWFHRGTAKLVLGRKKEAHADFDEALRLRPGYLPAMVNRGLYDEVLKIDPKNVAALLGKGEYDRAVEAEPGNGIALNNRGMWKLSKGDVPGALADFDRAIDVDPDDPGARVNRSEIRRGKGDLGGARDDLEFVLAKDPKHAIALVNRGRLNRLENRLADARADYDAAIAADPRCALAYANRASIRVHDGDVEGAKVDYREFLRLAPDHAYAPQIRNNLEELERN